MMPFPQKRAVTMEQHCGLITGNKEPGKPDLQLLVMRSLDPANFFIYSVILLKFVNLLTIWIFPSATEEHLSNPVHQ